MIQHDTISRNSEVMVIISQHPPMHVGNSSKNCKNSTKHVFPNEQHGEDSNRDVVKQP